MGIFGAAYGWWGGSPFLKSVTHILQWRKLANFVISRIQIAFWYIISNSSESLKIFLINLVIILMMSAKMATPDLLVIMVFWNKGYGVIIPVDDVTNKFLSRDSNYIVDVFMWPKFGNSTRSYHNLNFIRHWDKRHWHLKYCKRKLIC